MQQPDFITALSTDEALTLDARSPLDLSSEPSAFWIQEGSVDLFFIHQQKGKEGFRDYCTSFTEGDILWPIPGNDQVKAIAVGHQGTQLVPLDISRIEEINDPESLGSVIDTWLKKITKGLLGDEKSSRPLTPLQGGKSIELEKDTAISTSKKVYWLDLSGGRFNCCDRFSLEKKAKIPVTPHLWITIPEDGEYEFSRTPELIDNLKISERLREFHQFLLDVYHQKFIEEREKEEELLEQSIRERKSDRRTAFSGLSNVIRDAEQHTQTFEETQSGIPLVDAIDLVAGDNATVETPADLHTDSFSVALKEILRHNKLRSRQIKLEDNWWQKESGAMLGFFGDDQQPVALLSAKNTYEIHNPSTGTVLEVDEEIAEEISGAAYGIYASFPDKKISLRDLFQFSIQDNKKELWTIGIVGLLASLLGLLTPIFTGYIFDQAIPDSSYTELFQISAALVFAALASVTFQATRGIALLRLEGKTDITLQAGIWDRILKLPSRFFRRFSSGELAYRANGINSIRQLLTGATVTTLLTSLFNLVNVGLLFWYAPTLGWIALGLLFLALVVLSATVWYRIEYQKKSLTVSQKLAGTVQQFLSGISKIKTTGSEGSALLVWAKKFAKQVNYNFRLQNNQNISSVFINIYPIITSGVIFYMVGSAEHHMQLSTGTYLAFSSAFTTLLTTMTTLTQTAEKLIQVRVIYEKSKPILETLPEVDESKKNPGTLQGQVGVEGLNFRYLDNGPLVLKNISFSIEPGEFVAVVGPSGSGKSTLFRLLLGFETPETGNIYFDDKSLADLDVGLVRRQFGVVLQESKLMAGSIFRNIVGSKTELSMDDAWEAAEKVGLADDIRAMPMKMHTMVSENGGNISGGQKQRLMIARAIIQRPNILLMDEATSALDNHTQKLVSESLDHIKATRIVIAHRLSTIVNADKIIVLQDGAIQEMGDYDQLMNNEDVFADLANRQIA